MQNFEHLCVLANSTDRSVDDHFKWDAIPSI